MHYHYTFTQFVLTFFENSCKSKVISLNILCSICNIVLYGPMIIRGGPVTTVKCVM